ncbi:MAG: hypothetical protein AB7D38_12025 [Sulfurimonas sp.]|uniref:hypothetical protein n=1 Tax=Sulfurimonas sp. TaxID=2022749 RepID=UPI003D0A1869
MKKAFKNKLYKLVAELKELRAIKNKSKAQLKAIKAKQQELDKISALLEEASTNTVEAI